MAGHSSASLIDWGVPGQRFGGCWRFELNAPPGAVIRHHPQRLQSAESWGQTYESRQSSTRYSHCLMTTPTTVEELLDYWPGNIPFQGSLVSDDGSCMCAQGQALHFIGGLTVDELRRVDQAEADKRVAQLFGISRTHSVLLRLVNDNQQGAPSSVIRNPEQILGDQAQVVLAFWRHLDHMTPAAWAAAGEATKAATKAAARAAARAAAWEAARAAVGAAVGEATWEAAVRAAAWAAAWEAARAAARAAAWEATGEAGWAAAWEAPWEATWAAVGASNEIQGAAVMRERNQPFFFLPLFGFANPEAVIKAP